MPLATDVNLPKQHAARFPDRCVVCGRAAPGGTTRVITGTIGWWTWLLWMFGKPLIVKAPACWGCGWRLHLRRVIGVLVVIGVGVAVCWLAYPWLRQHVPRAARKWVAMALALVGLIPFLAYHIFRPPAFDITAYGDSVDYEFRDEELAREFAALNQDAEWVKVE